MTGRVSFHWVLRFPPPIKLDWHDITEILLKVELDIINQKTYQHSVILFQGEIVR